MSRPTARAGRLAAALSAAILLPQALASGLDNEAARKPSPAAAPLASLPTFACKETLGLDWPRTMVTYEVRLRPGVAPTGGVHLVNAEGQEVPCQLWRIKRHPDGSIDTARVSFMSELKANRSYLFKLAPGKFKAWKGAPTAADEKASLVLDNGITAVRLPRQGKVDFPSPLPFGSKDHAESIRLYGKQAESGVAPGPFQGIRLADGRWTGGSYFWAENAGRAPKVAGLSCRVTETGPLFAEAEVRYAFAGGGWYQFTARVLAEDPAIRIDEQFDWGRTGSEWEHRMLVSLGVGWKPDVAYGAFGANRSVGGKDGAFDAKSGELGFKSTLPCTRIAYAEPFTKIYDVAVAYPWHPNAFLFGLADTATMTPANRDKRAIPFVGVVPMHAGNWRGATDASDGMLFSYKAGDVCLNWRLMASPHPNSLLHTGEYDPALPLSFCRRQWALVCGTFQPGDALWAFRAREGHVNLDDYKDWILEWPADPKVTYPRLVFSREEVERARPRLEGMPGAETLHRFLYFNENAGRRQELWNNLSGNNEWSGPKGQALCDLTRGDDGLPWWSSYRQAQMAGWAGNMDELLSSPQLTPEQRVTLRAYVAAVCYVLSEPDVNPRGSMIHLGNPNMPINRFCGLAFAAALIPDHPRAAEWLDVAGKYVRYKLAMNTAPGGCWSELITYFGASAPHLMQTAMVVGQTGRLDDATARLSALPARFTAYLLAPKDPRFGARTLPNWGHEGGDITTHWMVAAALMRDRDPELAKSLAWCWDQLGRPMEQHHDAGFSERVVLHTGPLMAGIKPGDVPEVMKSAWIPGFGGVLRAHPGTENETYLAFRQGYMVSHCDANQGDFVLYAKGVPFTPLSLFGYAITNTPAYNQLFREFGWHSRVRFGNRGNNGGWPGGGAHGGIPAFSFNDSVDYLRGVGDYGPQRWTRQILFLKGRTAAAPSHFVFRDSFLKLGGALEQKWWYLRTLGRKDQVVPKAAGFEVVSEWGPKLDVRFVQPASVQLETRDASGTGPLYNRAAINWQKAHSAKESTSISVQETMSVTAAGPVAAGQDILVVLTPLGKDEAPPLVEAAGDGAVKIVTPEGTDYAFLGGDRPVKFQGGEAGFEGWAGAVRLFSKGKETHLVVAEGPGAAAGRGGALQSPIPALKLLPGGKTVAPPAAASKTGVFDVIQEPGRIAGKMEGLGGFHILRPQGIDRLPMLLIDGQTYAPGTWGDQLIIPLMPGSHTFEIRPLEQPPIFRNWQAWSGDPAATGKPQGSMPKPASPTAGR